MPTNHGHTPWKMAKFIFRNFLTILVDTVAPNFIFWAHCAQNRNFLTILVDTVVPKLILAFFCPTVKLFDNFRWQSVQNWNFLTILADTEAKIETFWQFKVTQSKILTILAPNFRHFLLFWQNWNFLTILGDTVAKIETFWQFKVTHSKILAILAPNFRHFLPFLAKLKLFDDFRWHSGQNWNFLTI